MKTKLILFVVAILVGHALMLAQEPTTSKPPPAPATDTVKDAATEPLEAEPDKPAHGGKPAQVAEPTKADRWRADVSAWKDARRVDEGTESGSIEELNRSVLVIGTVSGDISTISGDIAVLGNVTGDVSSVAGTITVLGTVDGDVSVVGGSLRVAGKVKGDASVVGGTLDVATGGEVLGESNSIGIHGLNFNFHDGHNWHGHFKSGSHSFFHDFWFSRGMLIWRSGLLILWVALSCAMAALFQPAILRAQSELRTAPARSAAFGFLWTILFWMLLVAFLILSFVLIGLPLLIVLIAFDLALSAFGMTLTFSIVGDWLARRLNHPNASLYAAVFAGACFLGLLRLVPVFGSLIWFVASLFGIGATLAARFGTAPPTPQSAPSLPPVMAA
jgi:hypothetical protein